MITDSYNCLYENRHIKENRYKLIEIDNVMRDYKKKEVQGIVMVLRVYYACYALTLLFIAIMVICKSN